MTPKSFLITALAVGFLLLHGTRAAPGVNRTPKEMTDAEMAELDKKLEAMTTEDIEKYLKKQKADSIKWLNENREPLKQKVDEFVDKALVELAKEPTPEDLAALEKKLSDFSVEGVKVQQSKSKVAMEKIKTLMEELATIFPTPPAPQ